MMKEIQLNGSWVLSVADGPKQLETPNLPGEIPISVPGDIASALLAAGLIENPYYGRNELDSLWIGKTDWKLSTSFKLSSGELDESGYGAFLVFEVIDTVAEIRLNGKELCRSRNMFRRISLDSAGYLKAGENLLEVIIRSPEAYTAAAAEKLPYPIPQGNQLPWQWTHRNLLRKPGCHGGWDWGITLMTGGIYEIPVLSLGEEGRIEYITTRTVLEEAFPGRSREDSRSPEIPENADWALTVGCEYENIRASEVTLKYEIYGSTSLETFKLQPGTNRLSHTIRVKSPRLWWPAGQGEQKLYELRVTPAAVPGISGSPGKTIIKKIGFRTVEVISEDDNVGRSMFFRINGRDIFAKGANWIPVDAMPSRHTPEVYRRLLEDAAEANMNMIRLWGGGQYEREIFYEICDELGLMLWHDMMFSCSLYPSDKEFLNEVEGEIRHQLKRLSTHASIVLWCGNNEDLGALTWFPESRENRDRYVVDYDRLNEGVIGRLVEELDPGRPWWPSSPSAGPGDYSDCWHDDTKGDMHYWSVWHEGKPFEAYYDVIPRFCSEFGFQSFPSPETVAGYAPENQRNISSPVMRHHQKHNAGNTIILSTMARYFRMPSSFEETLYLSQVQQAMAIRTAVDYWRAQRPVSMGALYWQLNDLWPVASWSSIEYSGKWKLLHYEARRFFAPLRLSLYRKDGKLHVFALNDHPVEVCGRVIIRLLGFDGSEIQRRVLDDLCCPAGSAVSVLGIPLSELEGEGVRRFPGGAVSHMEEAPDVVEEGLTDRFITAEWEIDGEEGGSGEQGASPAGIGLSGEGLSVTPQIFSSLFLTAARDCELADPLISVSPGGDAETILLETDAPAFHVQAECPLSGRFDDAGFTLLPGEVKQLRFLPADGSDISEAGGTLADMVKVRHL